jgi:hypothetical protein
VELEWIFDYISKYDMKISSAELIAELRKEYVFKQPIWNESLHELLRIMVPNL